MAGTSSAAPISCDWIDAEEEQEGGGGTESRLDISSDSDAPSCMLWRSSDTLWISIRSARLLLLFNDDLSEREDCDMSFSDKDFFNHVASFRFLERFQVAFLVAL